MQVPTIHHTRRGLLVKATARDFPSLAELAPFLDLQPVGLAGAAVARLEAVSVQGRAA